MSAVLLGLLAALCWGSADFAARFTGRALTPAASLLAVMVVGAGGLGLWLTLAGAQPSPLDLSPWAAAMSLAVVAAMLLFYTALRRGRVALVVPLTGSYPAWTLVITALIDHAFPSAPELAAMLAIMAGATIVARTSPSDEGSTRPDPLVIPLALASGLFFAASFRLGREATLIHGEAMAVWHARWFGAAVLLLMPQARRVDLGKTLRWLPVLIVQGGLDTIGILFVLNAQEGIDSATATVVSSIFGIFTILWALIVLRERVTAGQWLGILLVFGGVGSLAQLS